MTSEGIARSAQPLVENRTSADTAVQSCNHVAAHHVCHQPFENDIRGSNGTLDTSYLCIPAPRLTCLVQQHGVREHFSARDVQGLAVPCGYRYVAVPVYMVLYGKHKVLVLAKQGKGQSTAWKSKGSHNERKNVKS